MLSSQHTYPARFPATGEAMSDVFTPFHVGTEGWGAAGPGNFVPMCKIEGKCACFRAKTVGQLACLLPS